MIHNTLGNEYCASGKSALLTSPIEKGNEANSAQMQMRGKNYFYFDEFNKCEHLNTARLKMMVNPGWQSGRENYGNQTNFKNTCNPICLSNFDFIIDTTDHGTWRRIYYYHNKVKFCEKPNPDNPYEKLADPRFIDEYANDPMYQQAMLSIMVHYYSILCRDYRGDLKRVPVPTIARETEEFRNRQDSVNRFITQNLVRSPAAEPIAMTTLVGRYIEWYNRTVNPKQHNGLDIASQFENSRIATSLERRNADILYLIGHRIRASPDELLQQDEEELSPPPLTTAPVSADSVKANFVGYVMNTERAGGRADSRADARVDNIAGEDGTGEDGSGGEGCDDIMALLEGI
jgi:phage/plasmid-associated DNA primase